MAKIQRFEDLEVWKKASDISIEVFKLTRKDIFQRYSKGSCGEVRNMLNFLMKVNNII